MGLTEFERAREENIARNRAMLAELDLNDVSNTIVVSRKTQQKAAKAQKKKTEAAAKRKSSRLSDSSKENDNGGEGEVRPAKAAKVESEDGVLRRSARNAGKTIDYNNAEQDRSANAYRIKRTHIEMEGDARDSNKRVHNP